MKTQREVTVAINQLVDMQTKAREEKNVERVSELATTIHALEWIIGIQKYPISKT